MDWKLRNVKIANWYSDYNLQKDMKWKEFIICQKNWFYYIIQCALKPGLSIKFRISRRFLKLVAVSLMVLCSHIWDRTLTAIWCPSVLLQKFSWLCNCCSFPVVILLSHLSEDQLLYFILASAGMKHEYSIRITKNHKSQGVRRLKWWKIKVHHLSVLGFYILVLNHVSNTSQHITACPYLLNKNKA